MNIALISREYPPFFGGGIGSYSLRFAGALAECGHRPLVITVSDNGAEVREQDGPITVIRLPFLKGQDWSGPHPSIATPAAISAFRSFSPVSVFAMQVAAAMPRLAREFKLDVIEAPDTGALAWFLLNARRTGLPEARDLPPIVTVIHSPTAWIAQWNRAPLAGRRDLELSWMERDQICWSDGLVCPSRALADWGAAHWGGELDRATIECIPYALGELEAIAARNAADRPLPPRASGPRRLLFTGRLEPRKGVDTLIAAFARSGTDFELHLVGQDMPGPTGSGTFGADAAAEHVPPELRARVHLDAPAEPSAIPALLDSADLAAVPAPMDNFPFTCVEAMAHGKPVIAAAAGGMGEMIRDGRDGLLFTPGDADSCAAALRRASKMSDSELGALGSAAARRILDLCGNKPIVSRRVEHYQRVIDRAPAAAPPLRQVIFINAHRVPTADLERLSAPVRCSESIDFAHAWTIHTGHARAFSTPTLESLALAPRQLGPLALSKAAAEEPRIQPLLRQRGPDDQFAAESTWAVAALLVAAGYRGAVVPDVLIEAPLLASEVQEVTAKQRLLEESSRLITTQAEAITELKSELIRIKTSRGWRLLGRFYDVLHILRGRGLSRPLDANASPGATPHQPYNRPRETGPASASRGRNQIA